ncbi:nitrate- and nitrite sensing domain-containing protein [Streptomyces sp. NPDC003077]|uniref:nitrate- and nitrite sensing domain-containing protein n=1 Tax=Streptomyces sp. NPDC003077 TaxID=3154443 RepID=UPI0033A0D11E
MRRSTSSPEPQASRRGNFTPPPRTAAPKSGAPEVSVAVPPRSGPKFSPRNWRVATRLNAILLIPVLVALVFGGLRVNGSIETWQEARDAESTAKLVEAAATYSHALIDERDRSVRPLLAGKRDDPAVREARAATDTAAGAFRKAVAAAPGKDGLKRRLAAFDKVEPELAGVREKAFTDQLPGAQTEEAYVRIQHPLMEFANELGLGTGNITSYGRTVYAVSLAKAAQSLQRSIGLHLLVAPATGPELKKQLTAFASYRYLEGIATGEYTSGGTPADIERLRKDTEALKKSAQDQVTRLRQRAEAAGEKFVAPPSMDAMANAIGSGESPEKLAARGITPEAWFAASSGTFAMYRGIEKDLVDKAVAEAAQISSDARQTTFIDSGIVLAALGIAFVVAGLMARRMSRNMRQLRTAALGIAEQRLPTLVDQLSRTEPGRVDTHIEPIPIGTTDEIGEVARAFDKVHSEAVRLAAEQAMLRGNVNAIFTNLSRRNQGLIERQLTLITDLENNEADPDQLEDLFQLDHLATRMRRNGENLLILAGEEPGRRWNEPVPLVDVLRAATSEVEAYERIELDGVPESEIHGNAVTDLVHLLAELLENATTFSSPHTKVRINATRMPDGRVMVEIHDKGIGLTAEDFADINHKLANPPTVDVAVSQRMGLFVVGRLADRHGIRVQLRPSGEQAGTTSLVMLPDAITHGGGGEERANGDDFTVSPIAPEQQGAEYHDDGRTAAELGFDDSYGRPGGGTQLNPVGRSRLREERRAALEAQAGDRARHGAVDPSQPLFRDEPPAPAPPYAGDPSGRPHPAGQGQPFPGDTTGQMPQPFGADAGFAGGPGQAFPGNAGQAFADGSGQAFPADSGQPFGGDTGQMPQPFPADASQPFPDGSAQPFAADPARSGQPFAAEAGHAGRPFGDDTGQMPQPFAADAGQPYGTDAGQPFGAAAGQPLGDDTGSTPQPFPADSGQPFPADATQPFPADATQPFPADPARSGQPFADGAGQPYGTPSQAYPESEQASYDGSSFGGQELAGTALGGPTDQQPYASYGSGAQDDWPARDTARPFSGREAESGRNDAPGPAEAPERVAFDRPGPSSAPAEGAPAAGDSPAPTDSGLPRRGGGGPQGQAWQGPGAQSGTDGSEWRSANDERWRRAERLREPKAGGVTSSGLPRRVPKANLVEGSAEQTAQDGPQVSRAPEDVRGRLSNLRRGVQQGRGAGTATPQNDQQGFGPGSTYDQER